MRNLLKHADMLVTPYEFNVNQRQKSLTVVGGVLSILVGIFSIFYMAGVIQKTLQDQQTIYAGTQNTNVDYFNINSNNTMFAIEISDLNGNIFENITELQQYFKIKIQFVQQTRDPSNMGYSRSYTNLTLQKCNSTIIDQFNFDLIAVTGYQKSNLYCSNGHYSLIGQFFDSTFTYLKIQISICNSTNDQNCQPIETIKEKIQKGINVDLFIQGSRLRQQFDLASPIESYPTNIYWKFVLGMQNNADVFIMPLQMDLKKNEVFNNLLNMKNSDENIFSATTFQKQDRNLQPIDFGEGVTLCQFYLRSTSDMQYYFITQSDLFTVISSSLSEATALAVAIMSFLKIFYHSYNQHKTFAVLMNSVFKFDLESVKRKRQSSIHQTIECQDGSGENRRTQTPTLVKQGGLLQQILNFEISYSFIKYLKYLLYRLSKTLNWNHLFKTDKEVIISQIAKSKIQYDLDLTNILKKLYEIDCLKLFFFDDDQLVLFNTFCSPVFQDGMANQKDLFDILTNQQQQQKLLSNSQVQEKEKRFDLTFVASSEIPINVRLARVARFFKAQLGAPNAEGLVKTFQRIKENLNENSQSNPRLIDFTKQNSSLFRLVSSQYENMNRKTQIQNPVPDEMCQEEMRQISESKEPVMSVEAKSYQLDSEKKSQSQQQIQPT